MRVKLSLNRLFEHFSPQKPQVMLLAELLLYYFTQQKGIVNIRNVSLCLEFRVFISIGSNSDGKICVFTSLVSC